MQDLDRFLRCGCKGPGHWKVGAHHWSGPMYCPRFGLLFLFFLSQYRASYLRKEARKGKRKRKRKKEGKKKKRKKGKKRALYKPGYRRLVSYGLGAVRSANHRYTEGEKSRIMARPALLNPHRWFLGQVLKGFPRHRAQRSSKARRERPNAMTWLLVKSVL